jgi:hypothetical protein
MKHTLQKPLFAGLFPVFRFGTEALRYVTTETNGANMVVFFKSLSIPSSVKASLAVTTVEKNQPK